MISVFRTWNQVAMGLSLLDSRLSKNVSLSIANKPTSVSASVELGPKRRNVRIKDWLRHQHFRLVGERSPSPLRELDVDRSRTALVGTSVT
jgi:hypothetical protein